ncbi:MAG TPA: aldo/keto reductase, partial [Vicinamibacterales bacterium]|nr:aldo/keto reductase [Vicinamibacterales bacterium]
RFMERGGNFIDTANVYTKGHSETIIGDCIGRDRSKRDRIVIATKFFGSLYPGDPNAGGAGRKNIVASCEQSLRRLQTDYIDLYWMHCWDRFTPIEETMRALDDLVAAGKVRYIGLSDTPAWKVAQAQTIARFRGWAPLVALQIEYSLLERTVEGELIPMALEMGLGVTPWSPLKSGVLSGKYTRENAATVKADRGERVTQNLGEKVYAIIDELIAIGKALKVSAASVALAWVQARPGVASTIIGARRMDQLDQNLAALDLALTADQIGRLDTLSKPTFSFPMQFLNVASTFSQGGTTVNGEKSAVWPLAPKSDSERY